MFAHLLHILRHLFMGSSTAHRAVPPAMAARLTEQIAQSEQRHGGEIRLCVVGALPSSYLWRHIWHRVPLNVLSQQHAAMMFAKLRVWDTEDNNGVLIYVQLAAHHLEIVADRGITRHVPTQTWQDMVGQLSVQFGLGRIEEGLTQAITQVGLELERHFPLTAHQHKTNELPNEPVLL